MRQSSVTRQQFSLIRHQRPPNNSESGWQLQLRPQKPMLLQPLLLVPPLPPPLLLKPSIAPLLIPAPDLQTSARRAAAAMAFAGLYGNLPSAKDEQKGGEEAAAPPKKEGWAGSSAFLPANLAAKRQQGELEGRHSVSCRQQQSFL